MVIALDYTPLEPNAFPGVKISGNPNLMDILPSIFNLGIAAAVVLAFIMIVWGGILYMTTDSWTGKKDGIAKITNSLYGLGIALVAWIALYTINPNLVNFNNNKLLSGAKQQTASGQAQQTKSQGNSNQLMINQLKQKEVPLIAQKNDLTQQLASANMTYMSIKLPGQTETSYASTQHQLALLDETITSLTEKINTLSKQIEDIEVQYMTLESQNNK